MSDVVKRSGQSQKFDPEKLKNSVKSALLASDRDIEAAEQIATQVVEQIVPLFIAKPYSSSIEIRAKTGQALRDYNHQASFLYESHRESRKQTEPSVSTNVDVLLVGSSQLVGAIKTFVDQKQIKLEVVSEANFTMLTPNTFSVDGKIVRAKRVIIQSSSRPSLPPVNGIENTISPAKTSSALIVGDSDDCINRAFGIAARGIQTHLAYDESVQDVVTRYLKKRGIKIYPSTAILSLFSKNGKNYVVGESNSQPKRFVVDQVEFYNHTSEIGVLENMGLECVATYSRLREIAASHIPTLLTKNVLIVPFKSSHSIADVESISSFANKASLPIMNPIASHVQSFDGYMFFTFGMTEDEVRRTGQGYKKSTAKLPKTDKSAPTVFIKLICTTKNQIIGISGLLPKGSIDLQLLEVMNAKKYEAHAIKDYICYDHSMAPLLCDAINSITK